MEIKCDIYTCAKKADTYLYLRSDLPPKELPDGLLVLLGDLKQFLCLELNESSKLARVNSLDVLTALGEQGYYLQMPPGDLLKSQAPGSDYIQ
jgi:uncharacterized protein YcgL (UPF0745 family)